ncbi:MAG: DUF1801 domain-containing protein [Verrucomicrobia bacterium]|jgi:uncharacterized protein|nr:DUF1801 domain-containing protein [Verrucomicrobiota bacterium]
MSPSARPQTVEGYLRALDEPKAATLRAIIATILDQFPELEAVIAWNVPQIKRGHAYVFGLCAYQRHLTLAPWSDRIITAFRPRLGAYVVRKHCFLVPVDWRPDPRLLGDLVAARLAELADPAPPTSARRSRRKA